jgi:hypothetical protein
MISTAARADAGGVGFWLPGGMGSLSAVPGQPGWSLTTVYLHLEANAGAGKELQNNASIVTGLHARADAVAFLPAYTFETPVLGGQLTVGAAGVPGNVGVGIAATLTGPRGNQISGNAHDERTTFADVYYLATLESGRQQLHVVCAGQHPERHLRLHAPGQSEYRLYRHR